MIGTFLTIPCVGGPWAGGWIAIRPGQTQIDLDGYSEHLGLHSVIAYTLRNFEVEGKNYSFLAAPSISTELALTMIFDAYAAVEEGKKGAPNA